MTFRPPATKPTRRRTRQVDTRRAIFMNAAFGFASLAAVALLGGVLFANWYADHGAAVGSVGGVAISKDAVRAEAAVMQAEYDRDLTDYDTLRNEGQLSTTDYGTMTSAITTAEDPTTLYSDALTQLQENLTLQQYAAKNNISVTDADVDAQIVKDGTLPELRHVMAIGVVAAVTAPSAVPTSAQLAAAQTQAQTYVDAIAAGTQKWADVATEAESSGITNDTGDLGITSQSQLNLDPDFVQAIFDLKKVNDVTGLFLGTDGVYRFATVTAIVPPYVDSGWKDAVDSASNAGDYRNAARAEALKAAIQKSVESQYVSGPMVSRHVEEIYVSAGYSQLGDGPEAKIKMMIFAPNHDTSSASSVDASDPAWAEAKSRADAAYAALQKDITQFTKMALDTTNNDDPYVASQGGDLPWLPQSVFTGDPSSQQGLGMQAVPSLIFAPGLPPGLLAPILEPYAWDTSSSTSRAFGRARPSASPTPSSGSTPAPASRRSRQVLGRVRCLQRRRHGLDHALSALVGPPAGHLPGSDRRHKPHGGDQCRLRPLQGSRRGDQDARRRTAVEAQAGRVQHLAERSGGLDQHLDRLGRPDRDHPTATP